MRLAALALVAAACGHRGDPAPAPPPAAKPFHPPANSPLDFPHISQLVTAVIDDWGSTTAVMRAWRLEPTGWVPTGPAWPAVIGKHGAAWGFGLHGSGPPGDRTGPVKHEGDGKSPAGAFSLMTAFGYGDPPAAHGGLPYVKLLDTTVCVDDEKSEHYGQIVSNLRGDWTSAEQMLRDDDLYSLGVVVNNNAARFPGEGSCIFLHVWSGPGSTTVGCTAMAKRELASLIAWLEDSHDAVDKPFFVLLPRDEYRALAEPWGLPPQ